MLSQTGRQVRERELLPLRTVGPLCYSRKKVETLVGLPRQHRSVILVLSKPFVVAGPKTGLRGTTNGFFLLVGRALALTEMAFRLGCPAAAASETFIASTIPNEKVIWPRQPLALAIIPAALVRSWTADRRYTVASISTAFTMIANIRAMRRQSVCAK